MSPLYRHRPTFVEAWQWSGTVLAARKLLRAAGVPVNLEQTSASALAFWCEKAHAIVTIAPHDWVIREPDGSGFYPCTDEVFTSTYTLQEP